MREREFDLFAHGMLGFGAPCLVQGLHCSRNIEPPERPGHMPPDERLIVMKKRLRESWEIALLTDVAECDRGIAGQATPLRPEHRASREECPKTLLRHTQDLTQRWISPVDRGRLHVRIVGCYGGAGVWADFLADVTPEHPIAEAWP